MSHSKDKISELENEIKQLNKVIERLRANVRMQETIINQQADLLADALSQVVELQEVLEELDAIPTDESDGYNRN